MNDYICLTLGLRGKRTGRRDLYSGEGMTKTPGPKVNKGQKKQDSRNGREFVSTGFLFIRFIYCKKFFSCLKDWISRGERFMENRSRIE